MDVLTDWDTGLGRRADPSWGPLGLSLVPRAWRLCVAAPMRQRELRLREGAGSPTAAISSGEKWVGRPPCLSPKEKRGQWK